MRAKLEEVYSFVSVVEQKKFGIKVLCQVNKYLKPSSLDDLLWISPSDVSIVSRMLLEIAIIFRTQCLKSTTKNGNFCLGG